MRGPLRQGLARSTEMYHTSFMSQLDDAKMVAAGWIITSIIAAALLVITVVRPFLKLQRKNAETTRTMLLMIPSETLKSVDAIMNYFKEKTRMIAGVKVKGTKGHAIRATESKSSLIVETPTRSRVRTPPTPASPPPTHSQP